MKLELHESVASPQDLQALIIELHDYVRWFSHNAVKKQTKAKHLGEAPELTPPAKATLSGWSAKHGLSRSSLDQLVQSLETYAHDAAVMTITLAAPPTIGIKKQLTAWCRQNVSPAILVNFDFNSLILGGMVVRYGSHIYDWSFRRQIMDNRNHFPEVLRNV